MLDSNVFRNYMLRKVNVRGDQKYIAATIGLIKEIARDVEPNWKVV